MEPTFDKDGYPTPETLQRIRDWPPQKEEAGNLMQFIANAWHWPDYARNVRAGVWTFATGGWSGNEDLLGALHNSTIWLGIQIGSMYLKGGLLIVTTTEAARAELEELESRITKWAWSENAQPTLIS